MIILQSASKGIFYASYHARKNWLLVNTGVSSRLVQKRDHVEYDLDQFNL
jgi:hypothetical protein